MIGFVQREIKINTQLNLLTNSALEHKPVYYVAFNFWFGVQFDQLINFSIIKSFIRFNFIKSTQFIFPLFEIFVQLNCVDVSKCDPIQKKNNVIIIHEHSAFLSYGIIIDCSNWPFKHLQCSHSLIVNCPHYIDTLVQRLINFSWALHDCLAELIILMLNRTV